MASKETQEYEEPLIDDLLSIEGQFCDSDVEKVQKWEMVKRKIADSLPIPPPPRFTVAKSQFTEIVRTLECSLFCCVVTRELVKKSKSIILCRISKSLSLSEI